MPEAIRVPPLIKAPHGRGGWRVRSIVEGTLEALDGRGADLDALSAAEIPGEALRAQIGLVVDGPASTPLYGWRREELSMRRA